ncbi:MAG: pyridoxal-phosphate dependent enzyme [bacterium]|nr:pyridoxal-phosphate dependent enzyme [bacterium]
MPITSYLTHVVCLECDHIMPDDVMANQCPACGSQWLDARYDYAAVAPLWAHTGHFQRRPQSLWRYAELLPLTEPDADITLDEGSTPLVRLYQYERLYDHPHLYVKDERQGPTSSFKDRQAAVAVTALRRAGITECVLASTGNAAAAYAAYCARAGIKLWLFLTSLVPGEKMREAALYGAEVVRVSGTYDETKHVALEFARRRGIHFDRGAKAIPGKESMKTLAFEIAEQLGTRLDPDAGRWIVPDWYIQAVSGGIGPLGVLKGFSELYHMGLIDKVPKLGIIQAAGCAPMVTAFQANHAKADPVVPKTLITVLATGDPGHSYIQLRESILTWGGTMIGIEDGETFAAMRRAASKAGLSVEPATAVAFAGLEKLLGDGVILPGETVVLNGSGHTFPAESHILGDQYLLNLELDQHGDGTQSLRRVEGLSAAFETLDEQITTILVVDDNSNDRRLIRRLLQARKNYRVFEARDGREAVQAVHDHRPDLVVADLTMPEMDGFALLEHLKQTPNTAHIPVVVVSAKALNEQDRALLERYSESVWMKGGFSTRRLVDHIVETLGDAPVEAIPPRGGRPDVQKAAADPKRGTEEAPQAPRTVVIIDDDAADRRFARRMVESVSAFMVIEMATGRDGLKAIHERHPDLIILDLLLPDMDGFSVIDRLSTDPALCDIPIVVYSGKMLAPEEMAHLKRVSRGILLKSSIRKNEFVSTIIKALL